MIVHGVIAKFFYKYLYKFLHFYIVTFIKKFLYDLPRKFYKKYKHIFLSLKLKKLFRNDLRIVKIFLIIFFIFQFLFWYKTENIKPKLGLVPKVPNKFIIKALSFGDEEFYFRTQAYKIQNAGDTFGRFSSLKDYDYKELFKWFMTLDNLDSRSNYVPSLAAYYYSQTQRKSDVSYIVDYLEQHADKNPDEKWWWYYQATNLANHIWGNQDRALRIAYKLKDVKADIPLSARQLSAVMHKARGEDCEAIMLITEIAEDYEKSGEDRKLSDKQLNYMQHFIQRRINTLKEKNFDFRKCFKKNER
jgi:hypothetical protein